MTTPALRIGDAERMQTSTVLQDAAAAGRLTLEEVDERLVAVAAARTGADLDRLVADLPRPVPPRDRAGIVRHAVVVAVVAVVLVAAWARSDAPVFWPAWPLAFLLWGLWRHAAAPSGEQAGRRWNR